MIGLIGRAVGSNVVNGCTGTAYFHHHDRTWLVRSTSARPLSFAELAACNLRAKNFSARFANDCLFDRKVIALVATLIGMAVALVGSAQTSSGALI
jgi:hypothetical protein